MKTSILKNIILILAVVLFASCDNDDGMNPNSSSCAFAGLTYEDGAGNIITQLADADLTTTFFPNGNGPGLGAIEIGETANPSNTFFSTNVVTVNATGPAQLAINGTFISGVTTTCLSAGGQFRYDVQVPATPQNGEAELCVNVDIVSQ